jgi:uncharacterized protein YbdZ (MbtH family)
MAREQTFQVVVNHEEQFSIWPHSRGAPPDGWRTVGKEGSEAECLDYVESVWTDMRPLSLRREMEEAGRLPADGTEGLGELPEGPTLVQHLLEGEHSVRVVMRPAASRDAFWEAVNRGFANVFFPDTRGGTELTIALDHGSPPEEVGDSVRLVGRVNLDGEPLACRATVDFSTFSGRATVQRA